MSETNGAPVASGPTKITTLPTAPIAPAAPATESLPEAAPGTLNQAPEASKTAPDASTEPAKAPDPEPDPHLEVAKRFEAVAKKESNVRKLEARLQERLTSAESMQKEVSELKAKLEAALSDPVKYYLDNGGDPVQVAKRFSQPETEEQRQIRELKAWKDAQEAKAEEERTMQTRTAKETARYEALREFVSEITPENSPNLTTVYEAHEVPPLVDALLARPTSVSMPDGSTQTVSLLKAFEWEHGRRPTNDEIRQALEHEAAPRARRIVEAHAKVSPAPQPVDPGQQGPNGISNQHAAVTTSGKPRKLTLEERRKAARDEVVAGLMAGESE